MKSADRRKILAACIRNRGEKQFGGNALTDNGGAKTAGIRLWQAASSGRQDNFSGGKEFACRGGMMQRTSIPEIKAWGVLISGIFTKKSEKNFFCA